MTYRVEISAQVERDADDILEWLRSQHATDAAVDWFRGLAEAIESLAHFPSRCPLAPENREVDFEVRQLLYGRKPHLYRVLFRLTETSFEFSTSDTVVANPVFLLSSSGEHLHPR